MTETGDGESLYCKKIDRARIISEGPMQYLATIILLAGLTLLYDPSLISAASSPEFPTSAGGFSLNTPIEDYPVANHDNYLNEVIVTDLNGYRKGFITYGTCRNPGKILRIKLKYEDGSFKFFQELLKRYKIEFGPKPKFSGDQFGNVKSWEWSFTDEKDQRVKLVLQHNLKDSDESIGNLVKLSLPDQMNDERLCFNERHDPADGGKSKSERSEKRNWQLLIPQ